MEGSRWIELPVTDRTPLIASAASSTGTATGAATSTTSAPAPVAGADGRVMSLITIEPLPVLPDRLATRLFLSGAYAVSLSMLALASLALFSRYDDWVELQVCSHVGGHIVLGMAMLTLRHWMSVAALGLLKERWLDGLPHSQQPSPLARLGCMLRDLTPVWGICWAAASTLFLISGYNQCGQQVAYRVLAALTCLEWVRSSAWLLLAWGVLLTVTSARRRLERANNSSAGEDAEAAITAVAPVLQLLLRYGLIALTIAEQDDGAGSAGGARGGDGRSRGLTPAELALLPCHSYRTSAIPSGDAMCSICMCELCEGEQVRALPCRVPSAAAAAAAAAAATTAAGGGASGAAALPIHPSAPTVVSHVFHAQCIDPWLLTNGSCPLCRSAARCFDAAADGDGEGEITVAVVAGGSENSEGSSSSTTDAVGVTPAAVAAAATDGVLGAQLTSPLL